ncbi:MAG TPA: hypothetical protein VHL34_04405 [Rhizomicrobium sp.]|jgi:hypothetical protein|nr:hypothetical protein [Rhizomicrobium sp.]
MKVQAVSLAVLLGIGLCGVANAYEYKLQFTPNPGALGLAVAGYEFSGTNVVGNCSYYTQHSGSGRGGGYHTYKTYYNNTCTWDRYGNLLGMVAGAPTAPTVLYVSGTQTVYAQDSSGDTTGSDSNGIGGFVNTLGSHYSWLTPNAYAVIPQQTQTLKFTLKSDGEFPLLISSVGVTAGAKAVVRSTNCVGSLNTGATCNVAIKYNPMKFCSPTGLAYDTLSLQVTSNAGQANDFVQHYTITLTAKNSDSENCP